MRNERRRCSAPGEVTAGIHGTENVVGLYALVERADEARESFVADDVVDGHGTPWQIFAYSAIVVARPNSKASAISA